MKINEIIEENRVWASLQGLRLDHSSEYQQAVAALEMMVSQRSPSRNRSLMPIIDNIIHEMTRFANDMFTGSEDPDLEKQQIIVRSMMDHLNELKTKVIM